MLYVSSRSKTDSHTAYKTLHNPYAPDGGMFIPFNLPTFDEAKLTSLHQLTFSQAVAQILNLFFSAGLSGWDVECCLGRNPVRLVTMSHRLIVAESWYNPENRYSYIENSLYTKLAGGECTGKATPWAAIAIRIAVLFGVYTQLPVAEAQSFDIAVTAGDFTIPVAAWYARRMGLPVGTIICACNENSAVWDLIHRGEFSAGTAAISTGMPELDRSCPEMLEHLIFGTLGQPETLRYLSVRQRKGVYHLDEDSLAKLNQGLSAAVVGHGRVTALLRSIYRTNGYIAAPRTALAYGGLQDHRARTGESKPTLLLSDSSPRLSVPEITSAIGLTAEELSLI